MFRLKIVLLTTVITCGQWLVMAPDADAGLLRDWFRRCRRPFQQQQVPANFVSAGFAPNTNFAGLQPGQCQTTCQQTCQRVVVNYVPCTSYRTSYERVPVTQYRPQTSTDPCTGCSVTCMRPCTTYTYRARRVPYTTYRPVYRTETYRVPVTTITNGCNTCSTNTCATGACNVVNGQVAPNGTLTTDGTFGFQPNGLPPTTVTPLPTPADSTPGINPEDANRSVIDRLENGSSTRLETPSTRPRNWELTSVPVANNNDAWQSSETSTTSSDAGLVTRKWNYSPIKQVSYTVVEPRQTPQSVQPKSYRGTFQMPATTPKSEPTDAATVNQGWQTVQW